MEVGRIRAAFLLCLLGSEQSIAVIRPRTDGGHIRLPMNERLITVVEAPCCAIREERLMTFVRHSIRGMFMLALAIAIALPGVATAQPEQQEPAPALTVDDLRGGGYVIFF